MSPKSSAGKSTIASCFSRRHAFQRFFFPPPPDAPPAIQDAISRVASEKELLQSNLREPQYLAVLVGSFGAVSFLLAILGVYGVMAQFVRRYRRDIGIRMALGGDSGNVVGLVLRRGMTLVVLGCGAGLVGAVVLTRFMGALLFGVGPTDPFVVGGSLSAMVAVLL